MQFAEHQFFYLTNYHTLRKCSKENLLKIIEKKNCIISTLEEELDFPYTKVEARNEKGLLANSNIMTIPDYVKAMVTSYQHKYTDTELSKKLEFRHPLWERRKNLILKKENNKQRSFLNKRKYLYFTTSLQYLFKLDF